MFKNIRLTLDVRARKFPQSEVRKITQNFENLIEEGGYGKVFLGKLDNGVKVAVKTLIPSKLSSTGVEGFQAEVSALPKVHHKNLVKFIGYCADKRYLALVYEYMEGGSLQDHLSDEGNRKELSWRKRLRIAFDIAEGLKYLHKDCDPPIIHRDIKPGNILLTKDLEAKIGDLGLSEMFENDIVNAPQMPAVGVAGTRGYLDPEYVTTKQIRGKNDVYSFGVVLMVLITGLSAIVIDSNYLKSIPITDWVRERLKLSEIEDIIDVSIKEEYDENSVLDFVKIAEKCTRMDHEERPDITEVVEEIKKLCTAYDESHPPLKKFTRQAIAKITKNGEKIGEGGYGKVYRWTLDNGVQVAVKTLLRHKLSENGVKGFQAEVASLTMVHHKNLVKLIGYCDDDIQHRALVYEYMEGGSLENHLSDEGKRSQLSWRKRLQIACEVAEGLKYLHKDCVPPIIHRDIKPANILITKKLEARIGDFGLSKMFGNDRVNATHTTSMRIVGTIGYLDPQYVATRQLRGKTDVYSFGVVLMVLITGLSETTVEENIQNLFRDCLETKEFEKIIDETIKEQYDGKSVSGFAELAAKCTMMDLQQRPDITEVVEEIKKLCTAYDENHPPLKKFTRQAIAKITKNGEKIGEGGYGNVYRWTLDNGLQVAVKTLLPHKLSESVVKGFQAEVSALTKAHHKNIVKFIGYCDDDIQHLALVYEYMEGGSLENHLSDKNKRSQLSWRKRLQIACEVAEGLKYLHKDCVPPIIHRDIKPGNILLTKDLEAKIRDFGLSKMFGNDRVNATHTTSMRIVGTIGYLDPQYVATQQLRGKTDVYSFGVVLMVLITGLSTFVTDILMDLKQKNSKKSSETTVEENIHISDWVRKRLETKEFEKIIDERIKEQYDGKSVSGFAELAAKCTMIDLQQRPDITEVVEEIKKLCTAYDNPE